VSAFVRCKVNFLFPNAYEEKLLLTTISKTLLFVQVLLLRGYGAAVYWL